MVMIAHCYMDFYTEDNFCIKFRMLRSIFTCLIYQITSLHFVSSSHSFNMIESIMSFSVILFVVSSGLTLKEVRYRDRFKEPIISKIQSLSLSCLQSNGQPSLVSLQLQSQTITREFIIRLYSWE